MSNYICERCGKAILDSTGYGDYVHTCTPKEVIQAEFEDRLAEGVKKSRKKPISDFINI